MCPYCNNEMVKGVVKGRDNVPLRWIEHKGKIGLAARFKIAFTVEKEQMNNGLKGGVLEGYKCKTCNKIIINLF